MHHEKKISETFVIEDILSGNLLKNSCRYVCQMPKSKEDCTFFFALATLNHQVMYVEAKKQSPRGFVLVVLAFK